ncbi:MAG: VCBS repeat-containing protein, partial [Verrucomicrobia bacterium]
MNSCVGNRQPARLLAGCALLLLAGQIVEAADADWRTAPGCRWSELAVAKTGKTGFTLLGSATTAITFSNLLADEHSLTNRNLLSGSGVAAGDIDGDGLVDLYFCGLDNHNALYRNLGNWRFEDITASAGVACSNQYSTAAVLADIDGDGDLDLLVDSLGGGTRIFANEGRGHFQEITDRAGVRSRTGSMSMALADVDGDGTLDLYVANFRADTIRDEPTTKFHGEMINGHAVITTIND